MALVSHLPSGWYDWLFEVECLWLALVGHCPQENQLTLWQSASLSPYDRAQI